ncbi:MAG: hypothetical protein ABI593_14330 [Betaproteobacteria bacterium]
METMTARDAENRFPAEHPPHPRRTFGATLVACMYVLSVFGAPLIVRYGSDHDVPIVAAAAASRAVPAPRCATAPEYGRSCDIPAVVADELLD